MTHNLNRLVRLALRAEARNANPKKNIAWSSAQEKMQWLFLPDFSYRCLLYANRKLLNGWRILLQRREMQDREKKPGKPE